MVQVIVERELADSADLDALLARRGDMQTCMRLHGVKYLGAYMSGDGRRLVCVFEGPDAEAVRVANRQAGMAFVRAWTATEILPAPAGAVP